MFVQDPAVLPLFPGEAFAKLYRLTGGELRVALQVWLERIPSFHLADPEAVTWAGGQVRGPRCVPVVRD